MVGPDRPETQPAPGAASAGLPALLEAIAAGTPRAPLPAPGQRVGRFQVVGELGRGGFGVVLEARDTLLGRNVALKLLRAPAAEGPASPALDEAEAVARLSHRNVVQLHEAGGSEFGPYLVFELLRGESLARRLERGPLGTEETTRVALEVARGLAAAHAERIVHRDLKPANVFLCEDGTVKVLDFGLALVVGRREQQEGGTPGWLAPEQQRGAPADARTDVWALGAILVRALSGREGAAPDLRANTDLDALVQAMLASDPVRRPRDGAAVVAALEPIARRLSASPAPGTAAAAPPSPSRRRVLLAVGIGLAGLAAGSALLLRRAPPPERSVAVLPFADLSPGQDRSWFTEGLTEELIDALARVGELKVSGRASAFALAGKAEDPAAVGSALGVAHVLRGSVRTDGGRARISAQLVNLDGFGVWSGSFDTDLGDALGAQRRIAEAVAIALRVTLAPARTVEVPPEVQADLLRARQLLRQDEVRTAQALPFLERVVAAAPSYAPGWAALALARFDLADSRQDAAARTGGFQAALEAAERAVALDPGLGDGWGVRGVIRSTLTWDWEGALADVDRAVAVAPGAAFPRRERGLTLAVLGRLPEALTEAQRAADLDPLDLRSLAWLGQLLLAAGRAGEAIAPLERAAELYPEGNAEFVLGVAYLLNGDAERARARMERVAEPGLRLVGRAATSFTLGRVAEARALAMELEERYGGASAFQAAEAWAWQGARDEAFRCIDRAIAQRDGGLVFIRTSALLAPIRSDPRWKGVLERMRLPP